MGFSFVTVVSFALCWRTASVCLKRVVTLKTVEPKFHFWDGELYFWDNSALFDWS